MAEMHLVDRDAHRMIKYTEHMNEHDCTSLHIPVPFPSVGSFASVNNMSINVYGMDDDKKVIYALRVSSRLVPDKNVDLLLFERDGIQHYTTIRDFERLVWSQLINHEHVVYCCKQCLHVYSTQE